MSRTDAALGSRVLSLGVWAAPALVAVLFLWLTGDVLVRGAAAMDAGSSDPLMIVGRILTFLTAEPERAGRSGGIAPILASTGAILIVALLASVPLGLATSISLSEFTSANPRFGRWMRRGLDVLAGVPSIVFGLFGNAVFCRMLGLRFSILSGGLTLACMMLPLFIRSAEEGLRAVPLEQRQAGAALGLSRWAVAVRVVLPQALPGILAGLVLSIGRALAETAALIFTSGYVDRWPRSVFDSGRSLSIHIYDLAMNVPGGDRNASATALVLMLLLLTINLGVRRLLGGRRAEG